MEEHCGSKSKSVWESLECDGTWIFKFVVTSFLEEDLIVIGVLDLSRCLIFIGCNGT